MYNMDVYVLRQATFAVQDEAAEKKFNFKLAAALEVILINMHSSVRTDIHTERIRDQLLLSNANASPVALLEPRQAPPLPRVQSVRDCRH